ncbi:MAG: hypothetical protein LBH49_02135 [Puniceicoccales bacterium]|jgi:hypothetical protein|nr:hypothetical protein [Puniceicoccales bacterium]
MEKGILTLSSALGAISLVLTSMDVSYAGLPTKSDLDRGSALYSGLFSCEQIDRLSKASRDSYAKYHIYGLISNVARLESVGRYTSTDAGSPPTMIKDDDLKLLIAGSDKTDAINPEIHGQILFDENICDYGMIRKLLKIFKHKIFDVDKFTVELARVEVLTNPRKNGPYCNLNYVLSAMYSGNDGTAIKTSSNDPDVLQLCFLKLLFELTWDWSEDGRADLTDSDIAWFTAANGVIDRANEAMEKIKEDYFKKVKDAFKGFFQLAKNLYAIESWLAEKIETLTSESVKTKMDSFTNACKLLLDKLYGDLEIFAKEDQDAANEDILLAESDIPFTKILGKVSVQAMASTTGLLRRYVDVAKAAEDLADELGKADDIINPDGDKTKATVALLLGIRTTMEGIIKAAGASNITDLGNIFNGKRFAKYIVVEATFPGFCERMVNFGNDLLANAGDGFKSVHGDITNGKAITKNNLQLQEAFDVKMESNTMAQEDVEPIEEISKPVQSGSSLYDVAKSDNRNTYSPPQKSRPEVYGPTILIHRPEPDIIERPIKDVSKPITTTPLPNRNEKQTKELQPPGESPNAHLEEGQKPVKESWWTMIKKKLMSWLKKK